MLRLPTHVQLEITDVCNLRCKHCYHFDTDKMPKSNDLDDVKIIQLVQKMVDSKIYSLVITGGEPLARPSITLKVAEIAKTAGMFVSINTNLLLLNSEIVARLEKIEVNSLLVSCPASDPSTYKEITRGGDYNRLQSKLRLLLDSGIPCMINMVVTPVNHKFIRSTATDMSAMGIKRFAATPASLNVEHPDIQALLSEEQTITLLDDLRWCSDDLGLEVDILEPLPKCFLPKWCWEKDYAFTKRSCQAGRMSISISNIGDVRPCSHNPIVYGNLFQDTLIDIWAKMNDLRKSSIPNVCVGCLSISSCNGACRTNSLAATGSLNGSDRFMKGHIKLPQKREEPAVIKNGSLFNFNGKLSWRQEIECYSVSSKNNHGNLMIVNEEMFRFICWLEKSLPLSIEELVKNGSDNSNQEAFYKILKLLIKKEFICVV